MDWGNAGAACDWTWYRYGKGAALSEKKKVSVCGLHLYAAAFPGVCGRDRKRNVYDSYDGSWSGNQRVDGFSCTCGGTGTG